MISIIFKRFCNYIIGPS